MATVKKPWWKTENAFFLLVPLFIIIAIFIFLFNRDGGISGGQALAQQGGGFWVWVVIGTLAGLACWYFALKMEQDASKFTGRAIVLIVLGFLLVFGPWGKACTDKANGGVSGSPERDESYKPAPKGHVIKWPWS